MGKIFYIMGKSATGKDHVYEALREDASLGLTPLILYTTRPIRSGETDGKEYYFVNEAKLEVFRLEDKIIEERAYDTVHGIWYYFTADDGQICVDGGNYLGIGTLESYRKLKAYYGSDVLVPIYIEVEDGIRLSRALQREQKQAEPKYAEMCRRFLADAEDFSEEAIKTCRIERRFANNDEFTNCLEEIHKYIVEVEKTSVS